MRTPRELRRDLEEDDIVDSEEEGPDLEDSDEEDTPRKRKTILPSKTLAQTMSRFEEVCNKKREAETRLHFCRFVRKHVCPFVKFLLNSELQSGRNCLAYRYYEAGLDKERMDELMKERYTTAWEKYCGLVTGMVRTSRNQAINACQQAYLRTWLMGIWQRDTNPFTIHCGCRDGQEGQ